MMWYLDSGGSHPGVYKGCEDFPVNEHPNSVANLLWREIIDSKVPPLLSEILPNRNTIGRTSGEVHPSDNGICAACWGACWGSLLPLLFLFWNKHHPSLWIPWLCSSSCCWFPSALRTQIQGWASPHLPQVCPKPLTQRVKSPPLLWLWTGDPCSDFSEVLPTRSALQRHKPGWQWVHTPVLFSDSLSH